ncbi:rRNA maturation RNase YbeY [Pseudodesulfovibrio sediminis]|uniref:Endoribonuclease YbeY n=1 Tax=Pseudodesulfovibrio sediminis TaxID=2810563 RepID=A0ABM7P466_9BACT|nr:rRNA maturation RNase YbeY [Pseudodesulfovibrio sediminis]BCS87682.1 endoribonuclease YbeY [Pseudodesulfovibrio sediminis]
MNEQVTILRETRLDPRFALSGSELRALSAVLLEALDLEGRTFSLTLVDDQEIARLNQEYLGCVGPTNILSFPAHEADSPLNASDEDSLFLGELALSVDALGRETDLYGQHPLEHLARLLAHGILHLAGFDHSEEMFELNDQAVDRALLEFSDSGIGV